MSIVSINPSTGKQEFTCPRCCKVYTYPSTLLRHLKFECGKLPKFECPHCPYRSHRKENIKSHVIAKHDKDKKIKCPLCTKSFVHKFRLLEHLRNHDSSGALELEMDSTIVDSPLPQNIVIVDPYSQAEGARSPSSLSGYFPEPRYCSTPQQKKSNTISVMNVPKINNLTISRNAGEHAVAASEPQDGELLTEHCNTEEDFGVRVKEETSLDITDSENTEDPLLNPEMDEDHVRRVIF
uniref:C2H2-type domain-containing protein n=1 Tax=Graphocephala atropunctata TaxID=36148 RepID=A0A1B6L9N1_9HEMI